MSKGKQTLMTVKRIYRSAFKNGGVVMCYLCNQPIRYVSDLTIDHIKPKSKGGSNTTNNLAPVHGRCNQIKADTIIKI